MRTWHLVWREIGHRKLNFLLSLLAVVAAVASSIAVVTLIRAQELSNQRRVDALDDEIRKITKNLGFNIFILPADQNLAEFHSKDFAAKTMPEEYVDRLAQSREVFSVNHLRPALIRKLDWPERDRQIVLMGVRGVVPFAHRNNKKPLALPVAEGKINLGHVLASQLDLASGAKLTLRGEELEVDKVYPPRGNIDDITAWIDLVKAQEMLGMQGKINMIQALECNCESIDRLGDIQRELSKVLGADVQVIELATPAIARAKARNEVAATGKETTRQWRRFAMVALPALTLGAGIWVCLLMLANVRQRRAEIGVWRALGWRSSRVLSLFLTKATLIGLLGAIVGVAVGAAIGFGFGRQWLQAAAQSPLADEPPLLSAALVLSVIALTPLLSALASWLPAIIAAGQDPAMVLREE